MKISTFYTAFNQSQDSRLVVENESCDVIAMHLLKKVQKVEISKAQMYNGAPERRKKLKWSRL